MKIRIQTGASDRKESFEGDDLLPCPKCGGHDRAPYLYYDPQGQGGAYGDWQIRCGYCGHAGPSTPSADHRGPDLEQAIADWNGNEGWRDRVQRLFTR